MAGEEMQRGKTCAAERDDRDGRGGGVRFCCSSKITGDMARRQRMIGSEQVPQQVAACCDRAVTVL